MQALLVLFIVTTVGLTIVLIALLQRNRKRRGEISEAMGLAPVSQSRLVSEIEAMAERTETETHSAARLRNSIDLAQLGVAVCDESGQLVYTNEIARSYLSGTQGDVVIGIRLREALEASRTSNQPAVAELEVYTPSPRTVLLSSFPLEDADPAGGSVVFVDDRTQTSQVNSMRKDFVANASHELKTPLGALSLLAEALVTTDNADSRASLSERIQTEADRMTKLVDDILDLSLVEEQKPEMEAVDVCAVVNAAVQQVSLAAETMGIPIVAKCTPGEVDGDSRRLVSALANLLENAVHYTSAKTGAEPEPVVVRTARSNDQTIIEVVDKGIGIADRHQRRIFERFYRIDRGRSRSSGGTGLGLAIARHVVENHGGTIEVESVPGSGSTFRILLPTRSTRDC